MVQYQITEGSIKTCVSGQARTNADLGFDPVLQVRDFKLIGGGQTGVRYRVSLTDGVDTAMGIITSGVAHLVQENAIVENSIIRVTSFNMNDMNGALYVSFFFDVVPRLVCQFVVSYPSHEVASNHHPPSPPNSHRCY